MTLEKRGYAESSDIKATNAGHIFSIKNDDLPIENGTLWKLGNLTLPDEVYAVTKAGAEDKVVLALSVLYAYDTSSTLKQHEMFLRKEAGEVARGYELVDRDRYAVADYMISPLGETVQVGNYVVIDTTEGHTTQYAEVASIPESGFAFVARINSVEYKSNLTIVRLEVMQNELPVVSESSGSNGEDDGEGGEGKKD